MTNVISKWCNEPFTKHKQHDEWIHKNEFPRQNDIYVAFKNQIIYSINYGQGKNDIIIKEAFWALILLGGEESSREHTLIGERETNMTGMIHFIKIYNFTSALLINTILDLH